jgi:hypothetical protein
MNDANLESLTKQYAAGLQASGHWVSPELDWQLWRVHVDGAALILGVSAKTLNNGRSDPNSPHFRLNYQAGARVSYRIVDVVAHDSHLANLTAAA